MRMTPGRGAVAVALAVAALFFAQPGQANAHPALIGRWSAPVPPGGITVYEFGPGEYFGDMVWRGEFTLTVAGVPTSTGVYKIRMFTGTEGTLSLRDGPRIGTRVGLINFATATMVETNTTYRRSGDRFLPPHPSCGLGPPNPPDSPVPTP